MISYIKLLFKNLFFLFKICLIFLSVCFLPKFFLLYAPTDKLALEPKTCCKFKLGLENIPNKLILHLRFGKKTQPLVVGLITNHTGIDQCGKRNIDYLIDKKVTIGAIYAPEHGISGKELANKKIENTTDEKTNIPIISLYQGDSRFKKFTQEDLKNIDVFIFDIQDCGMRHYTYISILFKMMEVAAEFNKEFIVLDRPNPLGYIMEGPLVSANYLSFISIAPIPLRHAMSVGELAYYFKKFRIKKPINLKVVPMQDYNRGIGLNNNLKVGLSPNIQNIDSCYGYSFLCILGEGIKPFEVGIGSDRAFQQLMLPNKLEIPLVKWYELRKILQSKNIKTNISASDKYNEKYSGLKIKIDKINDFAAFNTLLDVLQFFKNQEIKFSYSNTFNKLVGTEKLKEFLEGKITRKELVNDVNKGLDQFYNDVKNLFIYHPLPKIIYAQ